MDIFTILIIIFIGVPLFLMEIAFLNPICPKCKKPIPLWNWSKGYNVCNKHLIGHPDYDDKIK